MFGLLEKFVKIVVAALALAAPGAHAHGYVSNPASRNLLASRVGAEYDVQSLNGNGPWGTWPSGVWAPGGGGNHPVCGRDVYAAAAPPQATWNSGQTVDLSVTVTAVHAGHFYFGLCPAGQLSPQCAYSHLLTNAADGKPYYDMAWTGGQRYGFTGVHDMRFELPAGFVCDPCVLFWHWVTGNSCDPPGAAPSGMLPCGAPGAVPEEFWNCADVRVVGGAAPTPPKPAPSPPKPAPPPPKAYKKFPRGDVLRCPGSNGRWISTGGALRKFDAAGLGEFVRLRPAANGAFRSVSCADIAACKTGEPATPRITRSTEAHWDAAHPRPPSPKPSPKPSPSPPKPSPKPSPPPKPKPSPKPAPAPKAPAQSQTCAFLANPANRGKTFVCETYAKGVSWAVQRGAFVMAPKGPAWYESVAAWKKAGKKRDGVVQCSALPLCKW